MEGAFCCVCSTTRDGIALCGLSDSLIVATRFCLAVYCLAFNSMLSIIVQFTSRHVVACTCGLG